ncbi:MAG: DegV family protein [Pygmaiobacter massiliensis]|nr:DegV family protein [Pygmaiobacter massiliensis]
MPKVAIFTNSVSDLSPALAQEFGVHLIPDTIIFGQEQYQNNIDIDPPTLYQKLAGCKKLPTTSHPNVAVYADCFRQAQDADDIICITLTSKMSGSYNTANIAAAMLAEQGFAPHIHLVDSLQVSFGLATLVLSAAKLANQGASAQEILDHIGQIRDRIGVYFVMQSLENARKGGRVGAIRVLAADLLGVKPVLMFRNGLVRDVAIVRGYQESVNRVVQYYRDRAQFGGEVFIFHANRYEEAKKLAQQLRSIDPEIQPRIEWVGAVIGIYTGEGCLGIAFLE